MSSFYRNGFAGKCQIFLRILSSALNWTVKSFKVSKMKVKRCASSEVYKLDVWIKGNLSGKKKLSFLLRKDDEKEDVECTVYKLSLIHISEPTRPY